ncbi:hypothetical protein ACRALDRAFT_1064666 [Sodiomyces alcalophilus JCM 7366]|uniref:uncharacterized protein n=1 Tax=Sodiomyces alcalophilus JCM 7366 TaxID=591952 RepID=UPI0039B471E3
MSAPFSPEGSHPKPKAKEGAQDATPTSGPATPSPGLRLDETPDALSLHSTGLPPRYPDGFYDDPGRETDDLPPLYTDDPDASPAPAPLLPPGAGSPLGPHAGYLVGLHRRDKSTGHEYYMDRRLDTDPAFLQKHIEMCALTPPRPFVQVRGTHSETVRKGDKTEKREHVDFDVRVEMTPFLYSDINARKSWREVRVAGQLEKVRRGTVFPARAPGFGGASGPTVGAEEGAQGLAEWCHRYCASHAALKTFLLRRAVVGFDEEAVAAKLEALIRNTGYRGHTTIRFPVEDAAVEVYNECRTNRWRFVAWVQWLCYLTLLFVFTWPWLFFRTKRFEVVVAEWHFSRVGGGGRREFVSVSEDQWYNMWARAIRSAVLGRRQGTLDQQDLIAAEGRQGPTFDEAGSGTLEGAGGLVRAGVHAMNAVNQHFGWGGDS